MSAALKLSPEDEELGEVAAKQFTRPALKLVGEDAAEVAAETAAETAVVEAGIGLLGILGILVAVVAVAVIAYIIYDYFRPHPAPRPRPRITPPPKGAKPCPGNPKIPVKPTIEPKPEPIIPTIPVERDKKRRKTIEDTRRRECPEIWDEIEKLLNSRHPKTRSGAHGVKYRYFDNICSPLDPSTQAGLEAWNNHKTDFENYRNSLLNNIQQFQTRCKGDLPDGAEDWALTNYPAPSEWRGNDPDCIEYWKDQARWALGLP